MNILYVEDDPRDADLTRRALSKSAPHLRLDIARSYRDALQCLREKQFDLLLTDLRLPDGDGFALLSHVRELDLPMAVVVTTGQGDEETAVAALKAGADDYVVKRQDYLLHLAVTLESARQRHMDEVARRARPLRVLYLEHNPADVELTRRYFSVHAPHIQLDIVFSETEMLRRLPGRGAAVDCDVMMVDYQIPSLTALDSLKELRQVRRLDLPIILVTGHGNEELAAQALRLGASDYVVKSQGYLYQLPGLLENAYHRAQLQREQAALRASEERFRRLAENAQDIIYRYRISPVRGMDYINPVITSATGYVSQDFYSDPHLLLKLTHPDDQLILQEALDGQFPRGAALITRWVRKDGTIFWAEGRYVPVYDQTGKLIAVEGVARDITERKEAEEMVLSIARGVSAATGEMFFRSLVVQLEKVLQADYAFVAELLGGNAEKITTIAVCHQGQMIDNFTCDLAGSPNGNVLSKAACVYDQDIQQLFPQDHLLKALSIQGYVGMPLFDSAGNSLGLMAVMYARPIEDAAMSESLLQIFALRAAAELERRQMESALQASERRFRALIENSADGVSLMSVKGELLYASPAVERILGYPIDDERGVNNFGFVHPDDQANIKTLFEQMTRQAGSNVTAQFRARHHDGSWCWLEASASNSLDDPAVRGVVINFRDITGRREAEERIQRQLQRLNALRTVDMAITASLDLRVTLTVLLENVLVQLGVHAADILLYNPTSQTLEHSAARGFRSRRIESFRLRLGESYAGQVALERTTLHIKDRMDPSRSSAFVNFMTEEGFVTYYGTPLIAKGQVKGVLEVYHRQSLDPDTEWINYFETLAGQAAIAIDNSELFEGLQRANLELTLAYDTTLEGWVRALDLRDKETEGHTQRVANTTVTLARAMGIPESALIHVRRGALLHDIGKIGIPDAILHKPGPLTEAEWDIVRKHPIYAYELLSPISYLRPAVDIPYCHHEKWTGSGYPRQLKGEQIPLVARIFAIVDVWDALSYDRPYRKGWDKARVLEYILSQSNTHFDPKVVDKFVDMVNKNEL